MRSGSLLVSAHRAASVSSRGYLDRPLVVVFFGMGGLRFFFACSLLLHASREKSSSMSYADMSPEIFQQFDLAPRRRRESMVDDRDSAIQNMRLSTVGLVRCVQHMRVAILLLLLIVLGCLGYITAKVK
jgi:hypothetical protein